MLKENHYQFQVKILIRSYQVQISKDNIPNNKNIKLIEQFKSCPKILNNSKSWKLLQM